jgi:hypothetical protein
MDPKSHDSRLGADLLIVAGLVALCVAARLLPHVSNFAPVAAAALFAGMVLRNKALALAVPLAAMALSDAVLGFSDWRQGAVVYAALTLPAVLGIWGRRFRRRIAVYPLALTSSLSFFVLSNLAVWAFSGMYTADLTGLVACYVAAIPFLHYTVAGDLLWTTALFGALWLVQARQHGRDGSTRVSAAA